MSQVGISVDAAEGRVIIAFDREVDYLEMTPRQAVEFAEAVVTKAMSLEPKGNIILPSTVNQ
jgi:hypothetical protein